MKRLLLYIGILVSVLAVPIRPVEVDKLLPAQTLAVYRSQGLTLVETDLGDRGTGVNVEQALADLRQSAAGTVYLDTVRYLLVEEGAATELDILCRELRRRTRVCAVEGMGDLAAASDYLDVHGDLPGLRAWQQGAELPVLTAFEDSFTFLKKVEKSA